MKKLLLLIFTVILLSSCVTQKACDRKFPTTPSIITKDSIVYRDSIVEKIIKVPVIIKGDTVYKDTTIYIDKLTGLVNSNVITTSTDFSIASAWVSNSKLNLKLIQKDTLFSLEAKAKEAYYWREKYNSLSKTEVKVEKYVPRVYKIFMVIAIISIVSVILWIIDKFKIL